MILLAALVLAASDPAPKPGAPMADPGADAGREVLVILDPDQAAAARGAIEAVARVTQSLPPRLLLVQADQPSWERVLRIPGVLAPAGPDDLPADLTPPERTFVAAWAARATPKARPGEGLSWDAPGYLPPDAPPGANGNGATDRDAEEPER